MSELEKRWMRAATDGMAQAINKEVNKGAGVVVIDSQPARLAEMERERDNARANSISRGKMLIRLRDKLINILNDLDDQADLVAFGSTNDADQFRDAVDELDTFKWDMIIREKDEDDLLSACAAANARADATQIQITALRLVVRSVITALTAIEKCASPPFSESTDADALHERIIAIRERSRVTIEAAEKALAETYT